MFIIETIKYEEATGSLKEKYDKFFNLLGVVPPHLELLGTIDENLLDKFFGMVSSCLNHPTINANIFPYLRLYIANKEGCKYCKNFNTTMLKNKGVSDEELLNVMKNINNTPFELKDRTLLNKAIKAVYEPENFGKNDLEELYNLGWNNKDIFYIIDFASVFKGKGKMIDAYLKG